MRHLALFDGLVDLNDNPVTTTLTPGNGVRVSGNRVTVTPTFTPKAGSVTASYLTFSDGNGNSVNVSVDIFS